ncbi:amidohydrolase family protein [Yoonia sp. BS5-3]|uniref:Amidohydrolase n=1 Tax=Yoonia phaeophyticola TaxID=3137369 RepID=A0ABZ2V9Z9_9RHOB
MAGRVDSHCHLWSLGRGDYAWLDPANPDLAPIARDFGPADLGAQMDVCGVKAAVLVQAAATMAETDFMLGLARQTPQVTGVVGWVDLSNPASVAQIALWATNPKFKGLRPMLQDIAASDWISTQTHPDCIAAMLRADLRFDALVTTRHLPHLLGFARANPDLQVVIDHAAKPPLAGGMDGTEGASWRQGMRELAEDTGAFCKLSGLLTEMCKADLPKAARILRPIVEDLLTWFGPDRLMWGSDWPVLTLAGDYAGWAVLSDALLSDLSASARAAIYGGTARSFYGLEAA